MSGSYCTGEAGLAANSATSANALLESRAEHDRIQAAAEAERQAAKAEQERTGTGRKEAVGWTKRQEGDEIELDKSRLKKALDEEKKRKNLSEEELVARAKKSKSDVTQEEIGESHHIPCRFREPKLTMSRSVQTVQAGLRRSNGKLQGRGGPVIVVIASQ